jgi:CRISPR-associated protein Cas8a1/Csx13
LVTAGGVLKTRVPVSGTIAPGFVQRHVAYGATTIEQPPGLAIALHFALVGTFSLAIDRKTAVMIVPDVDDLVRFVRRRGHLTPREPKDCRVASPADAALQAQLRLAKEGVGATLRVDRCLAVLFATKSWNEKQKSRARVLDVEPSPADLERFEVAMQSLAPRIALARPKKPGMAPEPFWVDSVVRPLVAENLATGRPWFHDFRRLIVSPDGSDDEQKVRLLGYETEGLKAMIDLPWSDKGEESLVRAVHQAMLMQFARIWEDSKKDRTTYANRRKRQMERWRLAFAGAKTPDEVRRALTDLWSRVGHVPLLRDTWRDLLPLLCEDRRWQLNRDLALLALASYKSPTVDGESPAPDDPIESTPVPI